MTINWSSPRFILSLAAFIIVLNMVVSGEIPLLYLGIVLLLLSAANLT